MWENKELKKRSKKILKSNYWAIIAICFILTFFGIISGFSTTLADFTTPESAVETETAKEATIDMSSTYTPGLIIYLNNFADGSDKSQKIASQVLEGFKGKNGLLYDLMYKADQLVFTHSALAKVLVGISILLYLIYFIFIKNTLLVGLSRFLIETRIYSKTKMRRVFFLFKEGGALNVSYTIIMLTLFLALYLLTSIIAIAVGVFMYYELHFWLYPLLGAATAMVFFCLFISQKYALLMIPFILAENPQTKRKDAFALSRSMMKGNILHAIGLDLSFIGWLILSICTGGLLSAFFLTGYKQLTLAELFMLLRNNALTNSIAYSANLNDGYLTRPPATLLASANINVTSDMVIFPLEYPYIAPSKTGRLSNHIGDMNPERKYALVTYVLFFFIFSFTGWCWEVVLHLIKDGLFINRGTMFGPWLPIYGVGGVMIILLLRKFARKPALLFACTIVLCSVVEYFTSWILEMTKGLRWWDYSGYFLNINGRICLEGALLFALGGILFVYFAGPILDNMLSKFSIKSKIVACVVLILLFSTDMFYSHIHPNKGAGITDYGYTEVQRCALRTDPKHRIIPPALDI